MPRAVLLIAVAAAVLALVGCRRADITYISGTEAYSRDSALALLDGLSPGRLADRPANDSNELRFRALAELRRKGGKASRVASLITDTLPESSRSVPFYVESASFEGTRAVLVVEAMGRAGGNLEDKRLWVLSEEGIVLFSGSR